ncbi:MULTISPECIES: hypothetical protein [Pacificibacter]|uniref:hypothetical protein n=1 Tax=Pacificibacter TaxID=1042323 RepID=UPI001C09CEF7|nr:MULTISPECIES: hypothetical protein [Pacificibacter]MBU2934899.1 hypothetical protein [Pacificibacter marinus]MDO6616253.1 hypothetical protein [Pacificibacter sp. 1_MG-2023]
MQPEQKQAFADRLSRIDSKGANTCGVVHVGETSNAATSRKITPKNAMAAPSCAALMSKGLRSAVIQVMVVGTCLALYIRHIGL